MTMERTGLLHLYYGDGKGKTTAAMGLALRALGSGKKVVVLQFLKGGQSGEIPLLEQLGAKIYRGKAGQKFVFQMNEAEKAATRDLQNRNLAAAMTEDADLLVLDEAGSAWELDMVDKALLQKAVLARPAAQECVLTAHAAPRWMLDAADYVTEMKCCRHPYQKGIAARKGIEY
jgi:cob(I)yrinic acid a,c-diamide adenosyltransferase